MELYQLSLKLYNFPNTYIKLQIEIEIETEFD